MKNILSGRNFSFIIVIIKQMLVCVTFIPEGSSQLEQPEKKIPSKFAKLLKMVLFQIQWGFSRILITRK